MQKIILGVAVAIFSFAVQAEYLSWYVGNSFTSTDGSTKYNQTDYDTATLYVKNGTETIYSYTIDTVGGDVSFIGESGSSYTYLIEVYKYDAQDSKYSSSEASYADIRNAIVPSLTAFSNVTAAWTGTAVVATPEPTSGLLLLMGFAMLGLKRKKEV